MTGLGFGLMYLPSIVIVSQHFTSRRALATGIVLCAAGAGTFLFAPLTEQLVESLGWRGAMRVLAGACSACAVCGAAMVPGQAGQEDVHGGGDDGDAQQSKVERKFLAKIIGVDLSSCPALPVLMILAMGDCLSALSLYIPYTHLPPAAVTVGIYLPIQCSIPHLRHWGDQHSGQAGGGVAGGQAQHQPLAAHPLLHHGSHPHPLHILHVSTNIWVSRAMFGSSMMQQIAGLFTINMMGH